jgi:hypothetical protein
MGSITTTPPRTVVLTNVLNLFIFYLPRFFPRWTGRRVLCFEDEAPVHVGAARSTTVRKRPHFGPVAPAKVRGSLARHRAVL